MAGLTWLDPVISLRSKKMEFVILDGRLGGRP